MNHPLQLATMAVIASCVVATLIALPYFVVQYRRRGRLGFWPTAAAFIGLTYTFGIIVFTMLPVPANMAAYCARNLDLVQLRPGQFIADIIREGVGSPSAIVHNRAILQVVLNMALFVPLGVFLRRGRPGRNPGDPRRPTPFVLAIIAGFLVSLAIELTQLSAVWGIMPCQYRMFDVDDLIANTAGTIIGFVLGAWAARLPGGPHPALRYQPRPVTAGRRILAWVIDVALVWFVGVLLLGVAIVLTMLFDPEQRSRDAVGAFSQYAALVPALAVVIPTLVSGRTPGEFAVYLAPISRGERPSFAQRIVRTLLGMAGVTLVSIFVPLLSAPIVFAYTIAMFVSAFATRNHRGLSLLAASSDLVDARSAAGRKALGQTDRSFATRDRTLSRR